MPYTPQVNPVSGDVQLQKDYVLHLRHLLEQLAQLRSNFAHGSVLADDMMPLYHLVHNLSGSASNFGFSNISRNGHTLSAQLERCIHIAAAANGIVQPTQPVIQALEDFENVCLNEIAGGGRPTMSASDTTQPGAHAEIKVVCILSTDPANDQHLEEQLRHFGYRVQICRTAEACAQTVRTEQPDVLILFSELSPAEVAAAKTVQAAIQSPLQTQLIVISATDRFETRLEAVRIGAHGFFCMPLDALQVIDKIEQLAEKFRTMPSYHVLIIDDDEILMKFYNNALERAGIVATSVSNPRDALEVIANQSVDLVLIDFLMPHCSGQELASIIRQHEKFVSMPIIFMSARDDVENLLRDTGLGIDDFLVKPITSENLVSVVRSRAQRSAELKALMARDSFTGLLNHGHFMDMLSIELVQSQRYHMQSAYAIIDIDHFKAVNDTYGHVAGDHVIKSLARMLQQRLRRSDVIGRCGGEEFGIIMPDCDLHNASLIVESMRLQFENLNFKIDGKPITVTFSAGLTILATHKDVDSLIKAADNALYDAKRQGRNRLIIA